ncbi:iron-sulfur cluster co-chaperone protein HscB [Aplysia californica]|uniref:Iron-sulfur cluster co-chaperone protein HscB n=1 Tax=Aplysia californica TaxID=6500 RepID=A0ABM0K759_APLCA|nr:iron-sulfur cluster co-chaperone protein HscB [Aplysia californica]
MAATLFSRTAARLSQLFDKQLLQTRVPFAVNRLENNYGNGNDDGVRAKSICTLRQSIWKQNERCVMQGNVASGSPCSSSTPGDRDAISNAKHTSMHSVFRSCGLDSQNVKRYFHSSLRKRHRHFSKEVKRDCWNCGRDTNPRTELFFCECGVVQKPAHELTFFDLMQMEPSFDVDLIELGKTFRETQKKLHPDKFSIKSKEEQMLAEQQSSLLNKAYNTLQKSLSRALYILELQGITISESDNFTDPEFLMEVMDVNEQISNANSISDVNELNSINDGKIEECITEISALFRENRLSDAKNATMKLRYYTTIQERMKELQRQSLG